MGLWEMYKKTPWGKKRKTEVEEQMDLEEAEAIRNGEGEHTVKFYLSTYLTARSLAKRDEAPMKDDWDKAYPPHTRRELRKRLSDDSPFKVRED